MVSLCMSHANYAQVKQKENEEKKEKKTKRKRKKEKVRRRCTHWWRLRWPEDTVL